jgi:hypothetical protein
MTDALNIAVASLTHLVSLVIKLANEAPDREAARAELAARIRRMLDRGGLLDKLHAEDQAILDKRIPPA